MRLEVIFRAALCKMHLHESGIITEKKSCLVGHEAFNLG